jgi:hypothetical protein
MTAKWVTAWRYTQRRWHRPTSTSSTCTVGPHTVANIILCASQLTATLLQCGGQKLSAHILCCAARHRLASKTMNKIAVSSRHKDSQVGPTVLYTKPHEMDIVQAPELGSKGPKPSVHQMPHSCSAGSIAPLKSAVPLPLSTTMQCIQAYPLHTHEHAQPAATGCAVRPPVGLAHPHTSTACETVSPPPKIAADLCYPLAHCHSAVHHLTNDITNHHQTSDKSGGG